MSDSDDYFDDDIVLDDETLAALDSAEQTYLRQTVPETNSQLEQPSKRQKTTNGWKPGLGSRTLSDADDLPDIIIENNWYGGVPATRPRSPPRIPSTSRVSQRTGTQTSSKPTSTGNRPSPLGQHPTRQHPPTRPVSRQPSLAQPRQPSQPTRPPILQQRQPSYGPPTINTQHASQVHRRVSAPISQSQHLSSINATPLQQSHLGNAHNGTPLSQELADIKRKLVELREENENIQKQLQENLNARYAREGEVTILRKGIERTAQEHAQQIARLKAAKEEADAKRVQMQKEKDLEMERMRSHMQIKRQELESSVRKPPGSARQRKQLPVEGSGSFSQVHAEMKNWNATPGPSNHAPDEALSQVPQTPGLGRFRKKMGPPKETLPGFFNSFATKTPLMGRVQRAPSEIESSPSLRRRGEKSIMPSPSPPSSPVRPTGGNWNGDVEMEEVPAFTQPVFEPNAPTIEQDPFVEPSQRLRRVSRRDSGATEQLSDDEFDPPEGPEHFRVEFTRIVIGCTMPSTGQPILKILMTAETGNSTTTDGKTYSEACIELLDSLSTFSSGTQQDSSLVSICDAFVGIGHILHQSSATTPLASLFHLFSSLCDTFPAFCKILLAVEQGPNIPSGAVHLVATTLIKPPSSDHTTDVSQGSLLIRAAFRFVHSLIRHLPDATQEKLTPLSQNHVWAVLLGERQPHWLLVSTVKLLTSLVTFPEFSKPLISGLNAERPESSIVDMLCAHLVIDVWKDDRNFPLILAVLTCFGALTVTAETAVEPILNSMTFLGRILILINHLTTRLWDDDRLPPEKIQNSLHLLDIAIYLLYRLIFIDPMSPHDLRSRLHLISRRMDHELNGTFERFMVVFSRLSHDEYPDWIDANGLTKLRSISEFARLLLGEVVDGDEIDLVWQAYQMNIEDQEQNLNDEELEAMKHSI